MDGWGTGEEEATLDPLWGPVQLEHFWRQCAISPLLKLAAWDARSLR